MTLHWACTRLTTLPDPSKPIWEQDAVILELLVYVENEMTRYAKEVANS